MPDLDVSLIPDWARKITTVPRPFSVISLNGDSYVVTHPDGESVAFADLNDASQSVRNSVLDSSVFEKFEGVIDRAVFYPAERGYSTLITSQTDEHNLERLCEEFAEAKQRAIDYEDDPEDFFTAYAYSSRHPAFWLMGSRNFVTHTPPTVEVYLEDDAPIVCIEHGETIRDEDPIGPATHYHDYRLDAEGATFEAAYIEFAKRVQEVFWWDGVSRVNA